MEIGVIGSGSMGTGIAQVAATAGHSVLLYDNNPEALVRARDFLQKILNTLVEKQKITDFEAKTIFGKILFVDSLYAFKDCSLVIEAIIEDIQIKQSVFEQLEDIVSQYAILASNTSSLSISSIASSCKYPERVLGIHFFNPAPIMKLVEVIPAVQTDILVLQTARKIIQELGKSTITAKDTPAFIVNRVARPFYGEALRIYEEGIADFATIDWALKDIGGFRMGPFTLMDYIGNDINYKVTETVFEAFYYDPRYRPSFTQKRMVEAGYLGRKTGKGYYNYADGAKNPSPKKDETLGRDIVWRILVMLINEAADALYWRIATKEDIDIAMTKGVNYPKGLLQWADDVGIQTCVDTMDRLYNEYHEDRYRCSPMLRNMAKSQNTFYGENTIFCNK